MIYLFKSKEREMNAFNLEKAMKYYDNNVSFGSAKIVYKGELGLLKKCK